MDVYFDSPELVKLLQDLVDAPARIGPALEGVISKGALNIKTAARAAAPNPHHANLYRNSITYTLTTEGAVTSAEVGPDKDLPQGALGNLLEFGSAKGFVQPHLVPAWEVEAPKTEEHIGNAAVQVLT